MVEKRTGYINSTNSMGDANNMEEHRSIDVRNTSLHPECHKTYYDA